MPLLPSDGTTLLLLLSPTHHTLVWQGRDSWGQLPRESLVVPSFPAASQLVHEANNSPEGQLQGESKEFAGGKAGLSSAASAQQNETFPLMGFSHHRMFPIGNQDSSRLNARHFPEIPFANEPVASSTFSHSIT